MWLLRILLGRAKKAEEGDEEPRCGECGYLLRGLTSEVCPECGEPYDLSDCPKCKGRGEVRMSIWFSLFVVLWAASTWVFDLWHGNTRSIFAAIMINLFAVVVVRVWIFGRGWVNCSGCHGTGRK